MELLIPQIEVPGSLSHPLIKVIVKAPSYRTVTYLDMSHTTFTLDLPEGIDPATVEVTARLSDQHGNVIRTPNKWTLKMAS